MDTDVAIVGDGPAGLAAAVACAERGLRVTVVGPDRGWPNTYGIWADELDPLFLESDVLAACWDTVTVATGCGPARRLARAYGRVDNQRLRGRLLERCAAGGAAFVTGQAVSLVSRGGWPAVALASDREVAARAVVDASGHRPALLRGGRDREPAWQAAYGLLATFDGAPISSGAMVFMDYRDEPLRGLPRVAEDPTFLYGMDLGGGRWFVEETSLARRPALGFDVLAARLDRRLRAAGARVVQTLEVERCLFPMGVALPPRDQPVIGFGGAAGMVHPATGYQVGTALRRAPALARALAEALGAADATAQSVAAAGWSAVWPTDLVRQRALHIFGLETLLRMDTATTQRFFSTFFDLDDADVRSYISGAPSVRSLAGTMLTLFRRAPSPLKRTLLRGLLR